jgi:hypothetical protein
MATSWPRNDRGTNAISLYRRLACGQRIDRSAQPTQRTAVFASEAKESPLSLRSPCLCLADYHRALR